MQGVEPAAVEPPAQDANLPMSAQSGLLAALSRVLEVVGEMNGSDGLAGTLQAVAEGIVQTTGFEVVAINYMHSDGLLEVTAVVGPQAVKDALLGKEVPAGQLVHEMEVAEAWGRLRFIRHGTVPVADYQWIPDLPVPTDPNGWHPGDDLLAPLHSTTGELIGILSVDVPTNGLLPDESQRQLLELLATQAEIAINNARLTQRLQASEASLRLAFDAAADGMAVVSLDPRTPLRILHGNAALGALAVELGRPPFATLTDLLMSADGDDDAQTWLTALSTDGATRTYHYVSQRGEERWLELTASALRLHTTDSPQAIVQIEDITARRAAELEARRAAARDPLTGLGNRTELLQRLGQLCLDSKDAQSAGAVLFCDLNDFKQINDTLGHQAGDAVLITCAARLASLVRGSDQAYRVGGDEFVILLENITPWDLEAVVQRIKGSIAAPLHHDGELYHLSISVGWALVDGRTQDVARILAAADAAMYVDKRAGRSNQLRLSRGSSTG